ncbi:hypothetical protein AB0L85_14190 [Streptomyces sp. NPDC052051]|uniref:hypothetical protein n=1 Tax=Streptomyces sp. NPDC052051 TaxID=3154649 RepID=UPI00343269C2
MKPEHARDAYRVADRIRPVLEKLWKQHKLDIASVRQALEQAGFSEDSMTQPLIVRPLPQHYENGGYTRLPGAEVAVRVHDDACASGFVQESNFEAKANGPYPETGCFEPPSGH